MHTHHAHAETRVGMDVDGVREIEDVTIERLNAEAPAWGLTGRLAARVVRETLERLAARPRRRGTRYAPGSQRGGVGEGGRARRAPARLR